MPIDRDARAQAESRFRNGDLAGALDCYRRLLELDPTDAEVINDLGTVLFGMGEIEESCRCYLRALQVDPHREDALENLRKLCETGGLPLEAIMEQLGGPDGPALALAEPECKGDGDKGRSNGRRCGTQEGPSRRIEELFEKGRYAAAYRLARRRARSEDFNAEAWNDLAVIAHELCSRAEAVGCIQRALELDPNNEVIRRNADVITNETQSTARVSE